jgi:RHS repeat-associated protein
VVRGNFLSEEKADVGAYRYGFNGKPTDRELNDWQDYGMRMYNARIGRFFTPDPLQSEYPMLTPYQFAGNTPIWAIDLDGLEPLVASDFETLSQLKKNLKLEYCYDVVDSKEVYQVTVSQNFWGIHQQHILTENGGPKQTELETFWGKASYAASHPGNALVLNKINNLSLRKNNDQKMAFQDIANTLKANLSKGEARGTIDNTFLHVAGQSFITTLFGEGYADLSGDIHERDHKSLLTGNIQAGVDTQKAIDNYSDIINNQWGQRWGEAISKDLGITKDTEWTNDLTSKYLNALQDKISKGMGVKFDKSFKESDNFVKKTTEFINDNK